jgi:hypothetical protein
MTIIAWLTLSLAVMAFFQAIGNFFNGIQVRERRKVAEKELQLKREEFEYKKKQDAAKLYQ